MKPILFNTEMVRAILTGRKTVTRRVVKGAETNWNFVGIEERPYELRIKADGTEYPKELDWPHAVFSAGDGYCDYPMIKVPYRPGDILYVRETWAPGYEIAHMKIPYSYKADNNDFVTPRWHPSIHMPREAARIFLRVKDVRVDRLQNIDYAGCKAEGIWDDYKTYSEQYHDVLAKKAYPVVFSELWDSTIKPADYALCGWEANPWVWVIEFKRISREEAEMA